MISRLFRRVTSYCSKKTLMRLILNLKVFHMKLTKNLGRARINH